MEEEIVVNYDVIESIEEFNKLLDMWYIWIVGTKFVEGEPFDISFMNNWGDVFWYTTTVPEVAEAALAEYARANR